MVKKSPSNPEVEVNIRRQNRRTLAMRISPYGEVDVLIPYWIKPESRQVKKFINDALKRLEDHLPDGKTVPERDARQVRALVRSWAKRIGVNPGRIQFRAMYRKWGSCSSKGTVTLNKALFHLPEHLVEYVVVHELVHLLILDHSPAFWAKVAEFLPNHAQLETELDQFYL